MKLAQYIVNTISNLIYVTVTHVQLLFVKVVNCAMVYIEKF